MVSWAVIALGVVFWDLEFPAVCFAFEEGKALLPPASEVGGTAVAQDLDGLDERLVVVGGGIESGHGVTL
jgi:hypothetical protein